jgi:hypothetical protein
MNANFEQPEENKSEEDRVTPETREEFLLLTESLCADDEGEEGFKSGQFVLEDGTVIGITFERREDGEKGVEVLLENKTGGILRSNSFTFFPDGGEVKMSEDMQRIFDVLQDKDKEPAGPDSLKQYAITEKDIRGLIELLKTLKKDK